MSTLVRLEGYGDIGLAQTLSLVQSLPKIYLVQTETCPQQCVKHEQPLHTVVCAHVLGVLSSATQSDSKLNGAHCCNA